MMEQGSILVDSVFEEKLCVCGHLSVDRFTILSDAFIRYKNKFVSFIEIVRETLGFEVTTETLKNKKKDIYIYIHKYIF